MSTTAFCAYHQNTRLDMNGSCYECVRDALNTKVTSTKESCPDDAICVKCGRTHAASGIQDTCLVCHMKLPPAMFMDVVNFHKKYKIQYEGPPRDLPADVREFRAKRFVEECDEINAAKTLEDRFDGYVDLVYIILGTCHLHGWNFDEAWRRVHEANMRKELCHPGNPGKYGKFGDKLDIVKPPGWVAPDLSDLV